MATGTPSNVKTAEGDVSVDLPAPAGWKKKFTPKKGATPSKNEIVFIAPDGEEIKSRTHLRKYLELHPDGATFKEFDWSTGVTPRRSSRLSGKSKESESPENETPTKRQRKSSSKKATKEKGDGSEDAATSEGGKEAPEASDADAKDTVEHVDKDVVTEKDAGEDPVKGGDVGEPAAEEEKAAGEEQKTDAMELETAAEEQKSDVKELEASADEQKSDVKEPEAAAEEQRSDVVKEQEAAGEEQGSDVKEQEAVAVEEQKSDVKEQVGGADDEKADVIEEAADMDVLLGTDDNEGTDAVNEDVQLEVGDKKEGDQVSDSSKQSNGGGGGEKGVENASHPSEVSEEDKQAAEFWSADDWPISIPQVPGEEEEQEGPGDFLASLPDNFLDDALAGSAGLGGGDQPKYTSADPKVEETADPVKESSSKEDEAENQKSVGDVDAEMQEADIEENQQQDPSRGL